MVGARRQPLNASGRPKRAATLKKEAEKEEEEAKVKTLKEKDNKSGAVKVSAQDDKV